MMGFSVEKIIRDESSKRAATAVHRHRPEALPFVRGGARERRWGLDAEDLP
jgi:hypothetical protein